MKLYSNKFQIIAWCFYDWANSSYFSVVTTYIFSAYFASEVAPNKIVGTYLWGNAIAISAFTVALLSPILGSIADYGGSRKTWIFILTYLCIFASIGLWFAYPASPHIELILLFVVIGNAAIELSLTFYNAMLTKLAAPKYIGRLSGWGWGTGYVGGLTCLIIVLFLFVKSDVSWLDHATFANVRICGPFIALWIAIFSAPLFLMVQDQVNNHFPAKIAIKKGLSALYATVKSLPHNKSLLFFLISRAFYIDGLNTLFAFGGLYAATNFHMPMEKVIVFGITLNLAAGFGAAIFAWVDDLFGSKLTIIISLFSLIISTTIILTLQNEVIFWILCAFMGCFVGPVQAASRSLLIRIVPAETITEKFGLFSLSGKASAFLGPWLVALLTMQFHSQRIGLSVIILFYMLGLLALLPIKEM